MHCSVFSMHPLDTGSTTESRLSKYFKTLPNILWGGCWQKKCPSLRTTALDYFLCVSGGMYRANLIN